MENVYLALDFCNEALQIAQLLKDEELIAEAKAKIGRILYKILKNNAKARTFLYESILIVFKAEYEHLKQIDWSLNAQRDLKEIQNIKNDAHIEFGKQYKTAMETLE